MESSRQVQIRAIKPSKATPAPASTTADEANEPPVWPAANDPWAETKPTAELDMAQSDHELVSGWGMLDK
jgi:hypothetical protein